LLGDWLGLPSQYWFHSTSEAAWPGSWSNDSAGHVFGSKDGLVLMSLWGVGNFMIIYLAALGDVPRGLYEAAKLDGAGPVRRFWHVTLPLLTPVIFFNLVMGVIQASQAFTQVYLVSDGLGNPAGSTLLLSLHLFLAAFRDLDMGYASAMAWILFVIVLVVTTSLFRSARRWVHYQGTVVAMAMLLTAGCSSNPVPAGREEVVFWHFWGGRDRPVVEEIVERFNASQDRYWVRAIAMPGNNLDLKFFLSVAGGDPPDLLNQDDPIVADWAHRGALVPLDELATAEEIATLGEWLFPAARQLATYNQRLYAMPNGLDIRALFYNKTVLDEHDLAPPTTIAELDHIAETIAPASETSELARVGYLPNPRRLWAWGAVFGGRFFDPNAAAADNMVTADDPQIVAALEWMAGYSQRYGASRVAAFQSGDQALTGASFPLVTNRRYALIMDGQWRVRDLAELSGNQTDEFGVVPLPAPDGGRQRAGWVNGNFFVVPRGARQPNGAWEFMKFWSGFGGHETEAARVCAAGGWIPVSRQVVDEPGFQEKLNDEPLLRTFVDLAASENQFPTPSLPVASFYNREVIAAAEDVMYRGAEPRERLQRAVQRVRRQLAATLADHPTEASDAPR
jgi:ABC-type glycerol-3-phosphate transport system substrate-binding protein